MAITAHFSANFADFFSKVLQADTQLEGLTRTAKSVGGELQRMVDSFSGTRLIQQATSTAEAIERIGGVSKLTAEELQRAATLAQQAVDKMALTGQHVPGMVKDLAAMKTTTQELGTTSASVFPAIAGYLAGMASAGALIGFGKSVLEFGSQIEKVGSQTGMTSGQVQKLMYIAGQTNTSMEALTRSSQYLSEALGRGDTGVNGAVVALGFSLDDLKRMDPYDRMVALAQAIKGIEDPLKQAAVAKEIFGKGWTEMLSAIKAGMQEVGDAAPVMSDKSVKAIDTLNNAWQRFTTGLKVMAGDAIGAMTSMGDRFEQITGRAAAQAAAAKELTALKTDPSGLQGARAAAEQLAAGLTEKLSPAVIQVARGFGDWKTGLDDVATSASGTIETLKANIAAAEAEAAAYQKWKDAMIEVKSAGEDWRATQAMLNADTIESIKWMLQAGLAQGTVAAANYVSLASVKAVDAGMKEFADTLKQVIAIESTRYSLKDIEAWGATAQVTNMQVMQSELAFINLLAGERATLHANEMAAVTQEGLTAQEVTNQKIAAVWAEAAAKTAAHQSASAMDQEYRTAVQTNALYAIQAITDQADAAMRSSQAVAGQASKDIAQVQAAAAGMQFRPDLIPTAESLARAALRPGSMLGLGRGPMVQSMITPASSMPWNITINYPIMDDPQAKDKIAGLVGDAVMSRLTRSGAVY
jgi:hypothetical protein